MHYVHANGPCKKRFRSSIRMSQILYYNYRPGDNIEAALSFLGEKMDCNSQHNRSQRSWSASGTSTYQSQIADRHQLVENPQKNGREHAPKINRSVDNNENESDD